MDVVGLGCAALDLIGIVPDLPELDRGVDMPDITRQGGGPVAQALVTLARLGASVGFIGRVGDDEAGETMRAGLAAEGVDISQLQTAPGQRSRQSLILVHQLTGKRSICSYGGSAGDVDVAQLDLDHVRRARLLHLDGHSPEAALAAANAARAAGVSVSVDAGYAMPGLEELIRLADVVIASEPYAASLAPGGRPEERAARIRALGPPLVVVTMGERGCFTLSHDGAFATPAFSVPVVDTTGAGDVFHGAYLFGLLRGWDLNATAEFAAATAAIKCMRLGGRAGIPRLPEVLAFLHARGQRLDRWPFADRAPNRSRSEIAR